MQIVIDISDDDYRHIKEYYEKNDIVAATYSYIYHGTPLPKGHGRLIDEREVYKKFYCRCLAGVAKEVLDETLTIIEADKAESEMEE